MGENAVSPIKYVIIGLLILSIFVGLFFLPLSAGKAQNSNNNGASNNPKQVSFTDSIAKNTLCSAGLESCDTTQTESKQPSGSLFGSIFGSTSVAQVDPIITVVNVLGQKAVYRIINGQKHSLPTTEIFNSYGFSIDIVQEITVKELDKYPLARLFIIQGDESQQIYYLTEGSMIRPMLNDSVFYSYGNRKEDIITINQKEYNYYPRNGFIFVERPKTNRDIYQLTGGIKRYLTPVAVKRMDLKEDEIAPVNQIEFDSYSEGEPVIF